MVVKEGGGGDCSLVNCAGGRGDGIRATDNIAPVDGDREVVARAADRNGRCGVGTVVGRVFIVAVGDVIDFLICHRVIDLSNGDFNNILGFRTG